MATVHPYNRISEQIFASLPPYHQQASIDLVYGVSEAIEMIGDKLFEMEDTPLTPPQSQGHLESLFTMLDEKIATKNPKAPCDLKIRDLFFSTRAPAFCSTHKTGHEFLVFSREFLRSKIIALGNSVFQNEYLISENEKKLSLHYPFLTEIPSKCIQFVLHMLNLKPLSIAPLNTQCIPVSKPEPGDVVIYGDKENAQFVSKHFGIYFSPECVYSKWGEHPEIIKHPLRSKLSHYGNTVQFVRRAGKFDCQGEMTLKLVEAITCSDGLSPYSVRGFINFFIDYFKQVSRKDIATSLENSMYGTKAIKKYRRLVLAELRKMEYLCDSRTVFLNHMKLEVNNIANIQKVKMPK